MDIKPGKIALLRFPQVDLKEHKLRPVLLVTQAPGGYTDWLVVMVSSQLTQAIPEFDEVIRKQDPDFPNSGPKKDSVIRVTRLAVVDQNLFIGAIGEISPERLHRIRHRIARWILEGTPDTPCYS
ncbi:MAG: type II toxin-antitoxin system PemK/MazF family toxin [Candidatus Atribacteria bacterium]|nr:type II toxin-antitoxin system PemK/MazF family toxin [Candidatus Atribacteria bacterium]